jgi:hypothetical protein
VSEIVESLYQKTAFLKTWSYQLDRLESDLRARFPHSEVDSDVTKHVIRQLACRSDILITKSDGTRDVSIEIWGATFFDDNPNNNNAIKFEQKTLSYDQALLKAVFRKEVEGAEE